jgi:hypothetical protein
LSFLKSETEWQNLETKIWLEKYYQIYLYFYFLFLF